MTFEQALLEFLNKIEEQYGSQASIKTIILNQTLYRAVEIDLFLKAMPLQPVPVEPTMIQLNTRNGPINIIMQGSFTNH